MCSKMKKILAAGVVCYVAYKLGKKYLKENNLTAEDVFDSAKKKAEEFAKQAAGVVPTTKEGKQEGKKVYTFGAEKRIEMVHLADGITGLYDNKKNYPIEKLAVQYSVANPRVTSTLFSSANPDNVKRNIEWVEEPINEELVLEVQDIIGEQKRVSWKNT